MDGILPLWKEKGMTSFDCVFKVRKLLKTKKVGHAGTLDPQVDGVLPICIGKATKVVEFLHAASKVYRGEITIGVATETEDAYGAIVEKKEVSTIEIEQIDRVMNGLVGPLVQVPPMYSAVKVNGKRLYEYARQGLQVERPSREVTIYSFIRTSEARIHQENQTISWDFEVECSKGTYVRTLAVEVGRQLGYPAHMSQLTRLQSAGYKKQDCLTLLQLEEAVQNETVPSFLLEVQTAFPSYKKVSLTDELYTKIKNGAVLESNELSDDFPVVCTYQDVAVAVYELHPHRAGWAKPLKML